jgi:hypothetical protein
MVMPSPFERMLQQASEQAQQDPAAAFAQTEVLFNKSLTDLDVRHLSGFAAHLGGALGRFEDTLAFLQRCLAHPALELEGDTEASVWRAIAVVATCAGNETLATEALSKGVRNPLERCRVALLTAQALAGRGRLAEAVPHLAETAELMAEVPADDELRQQSAQIGMNLTRIAEKRLLSARDALQGATAVTRAALSGGDWDAQHKTLYHEARAQVLSGRPAQALAIVQRMMGLERKHQAGPEAQFHTASLACRAQIVRGQLKIATGALKAARALAAKLEDEATREECRALTDDLAAELAAAEQAIATPA